MIEVLKQMVEALEWCHGGEPIGTAEAIKAGKQAIKDLESQEPVARIDFQKEAQQIVESKMLWKKFIDGTPLANDIACWMADFALQLTHPPQRTEQNFCPRCGKRTNDIHTCTPPQGIYYTPPQRTWQGLMDEEIQTIVNMVATGTYQTSDTFARAIEAKLKQKNHVAQETNS